MPDETAADKLAEWLAIDDIVDRLLEECDSVKVDVQVLRDAVDEIIRLRSALGVAAGMISTIKPDKHPEEMYRYLIDWGKEARRG